MTESIVNIFPSENPITPDKLILGDDRITSNTLTSFEFAKIVGIVATLISNGRSFIKSDKQEHIDRAIDAIKNKSIPIIIYRPMNNGRYEKWHIDELIIDGLIKNHTIF